MASTDGTLPETGLRKDTNWWGAFVIGLAGTILVTGIAPVMVTQLGASGIPVTVFITLTGWLLCLFLAELAECLHPRVVITEQRIKVDHRSVGALCCAGHRLSFKP